jgi:hypothetical protein
MKKKKLLKEINVSGFFNAQTRLHISKEMKNADNTNGKFGVSYCTELDQTPL